MPSRLVPCAFLILFIAIINASFAIQDFRYYQGRPPVLSPEEITLRKWERLLKLHNQNAGYESRLHTASGLEEILGNGQELRELERSAAAAAVGKEFKGSHQNILQDVSSPDHSNLILHYPKRRPKQTSNYPGSQLGDGLEETDVFGDYSTLPRDPRESHGLFHGHSGLNIPVIPASKPKVIPKHQTWYISHYQNRQDIRERGMKEEPPGELSGVYGNYLSHDLLNIQDYPTQGRTDDHEESKLPDFTYDFDEPINSKEKQYFGRRPNEPGYDLDDAQVVPKDEEKVEPVSVPFGQDAEANFNELAELRQQSQEPFSNHEEEEDDEEEEEEEEEEDDDNDAHSALERRADNHSPSVMAVDRKISNNIYFVAIVAGCSAAAMFILVLISLTWCRFQRGAKAAADVEYPAYGVTGPNKDTSPSGDRRLAQSAQMYHYQHQKQQIIAMESRTATARDPGSVSEAESDEENEEGDYTVYECPGLAPTGEMEVKNPLFHDDPTPATPAGQLQGQKNRSSD